MFCLFLNTDYLICYIQYLCEKMRNPTTVKNYINGLKVWHLLEEKETAVFGRYEVKLMLRGVARTLQHAPKQAWPMTPELLRKIKRVIDVDSRTGAMYWSMFLISFYLMLRKSNLVPVSVGKFNPGKQFLR